MYANPEDVVLPELSENDSRLSAKVAAGMLSHFLISMIAWDYIPQHHVTQALELAAIGQRHLETL